MSYAYVYQTAVARDELMGQMINDVVNTISKDNTDGMLAAFVDIAARTDDAHLNKLEQLINEYRSNQHKNPDYDPSFYTIRCFGRIIFR